MLRWILFFVFAATHAAAMDPLSLEIHSYPDAMDISSAKGVPAYIMFTGDECIWCSRQKHVFEAPSVVEGLKDYVVCYVDIGSPESKRYGIKIIPTHMVIDGEKILKRHAGYQDEKKFLAWLD